MYGFDSRRWMVHAVLAAGAAGMAACGAGDEDGGDSRASVRPSAGGGHHSGIEPSAVGTGLANSAHGHRLVTERTRFEPRQRAVLAFRIVDRTGRPVRRFGIEQSKRMHVIVLRRDLTGYQHVHPTMTRSGRWAVPLTLRAPGAYRAFADFVVDGRRTVLGVDLHAPGQPRPASLRTVKWTATTGGYQVRLARPREGLRARREQRLIFNVSRAGKPVGELQPYLGAIGHLVVLRERDLSYLHAHPVHGGHHGQSGPSIAFAVSLPTASRYRAFLQFRAGGAVRTVAFTIAARA